MSVNPHAAHAVAVLQSLGWTREHACGAVGNLVVESALNPQARGDFSHGVPTAFGIGQHHMDRVSSILHGCGVDMRHASLDDQLRGINWEIRNTQPQAYDAVRATTTAYAAGYAFCAAFERPADVHHQAPMRGGIAQQIFASLG